MFDLLNTAEKATKKITLKKRQKVENFKIKSGK